MIVHGINLPPGYSNSIDLYIIAPAWWKEFGREYLTKEVINSKTIIKIISIKKSVNHFPGYSEIDAQVELDSFDKKVDVPISIDLDYVLSTEYMDKMQTFSK
jgi:hypothetical protein